MHTGNKKKSLNTMHAHHATSRQISVAFGVVFCIVGFVCMVFSIFFVSICQRPKNTVSVPHTQAPIGVFWESVFQPSESTAINMTAYETIIPKSVPAGCKFISHAFRGMFGWVKRKSYGLKKVNLIS